MTGAPYPLQQPGNAAGRAELAHQVHFTDIDTQLQRCRGDQHLEFAGLEPVLSLEPVFPGEAAVMGGDLILAATVRQVTGDTLGQPAGVDEDDRGAVVRRERGQAIVDLHPDLVGHDRLQRRRRQFQLEVPVADVTLVDDLARCAVRADEKLHHGVDGLGGGRHAYPRGRPLAERGKPFQGHGQVSAAFVAGQCVNLVDDDRLHRRQHAAPGFGGQQDVERLRRRHENVRRLAAHFGAFALGRVSGAHQGADAYVWQTRFQQLVANAGQGRLQVLVDVVGQRLERRHVKDTGFVRQAAVKPAPDQGIDDGEKGGQGLARSRGGADQGMGAGADRLPRSLLHGGGGSKLATEPACDCGMKAVRTHGASIRESASAFFATDCWPYNRPTPMDWTTT